MWKQEGFTLWELGSLSKGLAVIVQGTDTEDKNLKDTWREAEQNIGKNVLSREKQGKEESA